MDGEQAGGGFGEPVGSEDLRADVAVESEEVERGVGPDACDSVDGVLERQAELLILVGGREVLVRVGVDAAVDAQAHRLDPPGALGRRGDAVDLGEAVEHDGADPDTHRSLDLRDRLVVAVEAQLGRIGSGGECDGELSAAADVDAEALRGHPPRDLGREERLPRVVDGDSRVAGRRLALERLSQRAGAGPRVVLVDDVERRAEALLERADVDAAEPQEAVGVAGGRGRPHGRIERVRIDGLGEPVGGEGVSGHGGVLSPVERKRRFSLGERTRFGP